MGGGFDLVSTWLTGIITIAILYVLLTSPNTVPLIKALGNMISAAIKAATGG